MNLSIIIPNYNGEEILKRNLPKILEAALAYKKGNVEIVIVDDASTDNSIRVLEELKTSLSSKIPISTVVQKKNLGFSGNVNAGVKTAKGDIVVLLNSDVIPEKFYLDFLIPHFEDPRVFAVGCLDKSIENNNVVLRGNGTGQWEKGFLMHKAGDISEKFTLWAGGGSSALRKSIWDKLGGLNEIYNPFYWEDIDLSYRAWKAGYTVLFENKSIVMHEHEQGSIKKNIKSSKVKVIAYRNQFLFVWINITDLSLILSHIAWLPVHCIRMLFSGDWLFFKGFFLAIQKLSTCLKYRNAYKALWKKSDKEVLKLFSNFQNS